MAHLGKIVAVEGARALIKPAETHIDGQRVKTLWFPLSLSPFCKNVGDQVAFDVTPTPNGLKVTSIVWNDEANEEELSLEDLLKPVPYEIPDVPCYSYYHRMFIGKIFGASELEKKVIVHFLDHLIKIITAELSQHEDTPSHLIGSSNSSFPNFVLQLFNHLEASTKGPEVMAKASELKRLVDPFLTWKQTSKMEFWSKY